MADQPARLEAATIKAEIGSGIVYRFSNDAASEADIPTLSGAIPNLKNVILRIQNEGAEKISFATKIFIDTAAGIAGTSNQEIFLVQSNEPGEIYEVWQNVSGAAVDTGKRSISAAAVIEATDAATAAAASAQESADAATMRVARFLEPSATPPTQRDDGQPLEFGDRYLNTTDQIEYIYKDSGWVANNLDAQELSEPGGAERIGAMLPDGGAGTVQNAIDYLGVVMGKFDDLALPAGSGMVGFSDAMNYSANTVGAALKAIKKRAVFIDPIGGGADDAPAINALAASIGSRGDLFFSGSNYTIKATLVVPGSQAWHGAGGQRGTVFTKAANCDMITIGSLGAISDLNFEGVGATYTGKGIRIVSGFSQSIERCRSVNMGGEPLYFDPEAGGGANVSSFEGYPTDPVAFAGIACAGDTAPHPRFFRGIWLSGANFALGPGAGNGGSMIGFYIRNLKLDPGSTLFHFGMGRVAAINDDIPLQGFDHTFDGVAFSGKVILRNAQGINTGSSCTISELVQESTARYCSAFVQRRSYPVLWTQTSATPAIGNGSLVGNFVRAGHLCMVEVSLTSGSTTTFGDSASGWQFSLPFPGHLSIDQRGFPVRIYDASGAVDFTAWANIGAGSQVMTLSVGAQSVRAGQPMAWASGDLLQASFSYMVQ